MGCTLAFSTFWVPFLFITGSLLCPWVWMQGWSRLRCDSIIWPHQRGEDRYFPKRLELSLMAVHAFPKASTRELTCRIFSLKVWLFACAKQEQSGGASRNITSIELPRKVHPHHPAHRFHIYRLGEELHLGKLASITSIVFSDEHFPRCISIN